MFFEGTQRFDRKTLRQRIRDHGGESNAFTSEEYTHFTFDIHSDYPQVALDTLYSMMAEPLFDPADIDRSRQVIHSEMGTSSNKLQLLLAHKRVLVEVAKSRLYVGSNLDCPEPTTPDDITASDIKNIYARYYVPSNMTLILMGHFDDAKIDAALQTTFANLPASEVVPSQPLNFGVIDYDTPVRERRALFDPEVDVYLFVPAVGSVDPANDAYEIAAEYLGEQLYYDVRGQRGLAYTPYATVENNSRYGYLQATTRTSDAWQEDVVALFLEKYASLKQNGIPQSDVERLRQKLILEFESKQRDNNDLAQIYRHYRHVIRDTGKMPDLIAQLQQVNAEQVKAAIDRHFPEKPLIAVLRAPNWQEATLQIGPPVLLSAIAVWLLRWMHRRRMRISASQH